MFQIANEPAPDVRNLRPKVPEALADWSRRRPRSGPSCARRRRAVGAGAAPDRRRMDAAAAGEVPADRAHRGRVPAKREVRTNDPGHNLHVSAPVAFPRPP